MGNLFKYVLALGVSTFALSSCTGSSQSEDILEQADALPVQVDKGDNWSLVKKDGKFIYKDEFENEPSAVIEGYFSVKEGEGYVLYKVDGIKPEPVKGCEDLISVGVMCDGLIPVTKPEQRITVIDRNGETKFELTPYNKHEIVYSDVRFFDGYLGVQTDENKNGFVNTKGEFAIKPVYEVAGRFSEGLAIARKDDDSPFIVIDKKGETVFKFKKTWHPYSPQFIDGFILVKDEGGRLLFVDKNGESTKCPSKVHGVGDIKGKYYTFHDESGKWGVMDRTNDEVVIRAKYSAVTIMPGDKFLCTDSNNEADIIKPDGEKVLTIDDYNYGVSYSPFFGLVGHENNTYVILDEQGKATKTEYYVISDGNNNSVIRSDYFNTDEVVSLVKQLLSPNGVDGYVIGADPKKQFAGKDPEDYHYTTNVTIDKLSGEGYKFAYNTTAYFDRQLGDYDYNPVTEKYEYMWTPDNAVATLRLAVSIEKKLKETAFNKVVDAIKGEGFKTEQTGFNDGKGEALFVKGNTAVYVEFEANNSGTVVNVTATKNFDDETIRLVKEAIKSRASGSDEEYGD